MIDLQLRQAIAALSVSTSAWNRAIERESRLLNALLKLADTMEPSSAIAMLNVLIAHNAVRTKDAEANDVAMKTIPA